MGPGIIIPVVLVAIVVPLGFVWARRTFKEPEGGDDVQIAPPSTRLTSNALRKLGAPPWRLVYEINPDRLGGVEQVAIGPAGVFAIVTSMDPVPPVPDAPPDPRDVARAAILRGALDDALRRCAMTSDRLVTVHWGVSDTGGPLSVEALPGTLAVDGHRIDEWAAKAARADGPSLSPAQVDLAWQTVVTAIGRPDPLA